MQKMWCVLAFVVESDSDSSVAGLDPDENDVSERRFISMFIYKTLFSCKYDAKKKLKSV